MAKLKLAPPQQKISELILHTPAPGKHCARNAIFHIQKAWEIRHIDREMATFRSITGEEEAAAAIFHSLKRHGYRGANDLNPRNHIHKSAVFPFLQAISVIAELNQHLDPTIVLNKEGTRFRLRLTVPNREVKAAYANHSSGSRLVFGSLGYPPDKQEKATQTVLEQAEVLCVEWAA